MDMREKIEEVGFWVVVGVLLFGGWAFSFTEPPLQTVGIVIFLTAAVALFPGTQVLLKALLRAARWISRSRAG